MSAQNLGKEDIVKAMLQLTPDDYLSVLCTLAKINPHPQHAAYITNKFQLYRKKSKITETASPVSTNKSDMSLELFTRPAQPQLKLGRDGRSSRAFESSPFASLLPDVHGSSAWQVPILFRGDLVPKNGKLFLDVEKLSMKKSWNSGTQLASKAKHKQVGNNLAIVDEKGTLVLWAFIYRDPNEVCQYITSVHRVNQSKVQGGVQLSTVRDILAKCLSGNTIVGAALTNDLKSLSLENEFSENTPFMHYPYCDLQDFYMDETGQPINLKDLVAFFFKDCANNFQSGCHSCVTDARMTMKLYLKMCELKEQNPTMQNTKELLIPRTKKKSFHYDPNDICKCNKK